jgi:hypothetical protein
VIYRPTAGCEDEASDLAMMMWTRQGMVDELRRKPTTLSATISGRSLLPVAKAHPTSFTFDSTALPKFPDFFGVDNTGNAAYQVQHVDLYEVVGGAPGTACSDPDGGTLAVCDFNNASSDCYAFGWADGGNPNDAAPITVPVGSDGGVGTSKLGSLAYGTHGDPGRVPKCIYAKVKTTDPFHPEVISKIQGQTNN